MSDNNLDLEVRAITLQLQQLRVEQECLERKLSRVQHKINRRKLETAEANARGASKANRPDKVPSLTQDYSTEHRERAWRKKARASIQAIRNGFRYKEHPYTEKATLEKGDYVRILNPKKGQCNVGIVMDFCSNGKSKIITDKNTFITRLPKNVHYYG